MSFMAFQGSLELGIIYAIMALGVFLSFRTLNMPDLTVDGSFVLGAAVSATMVLNGHPWIGLGLAFVAGCLAGCVTGLLHTRLKIQPLLAGILVMLGAYSVNLRVLGNRPNVSLINQTTIFDVSGAAAFASQAKLVLPIVILVTVVILLYLFLNTRFGLVLRATGDNDQMVRAVGVNTDQTILIGLALSNGLVALSGSMIAQYQMFADISMGVGMVVIGLASVIIGEVIFGVSSLFRRLVAVVMGAILYRLVIALAFEVGMPATDLKLVSVVIVILALSLPVYRERFFNFRKRRSARADYERGSS